MKVLSQLEIIRQELGDKLQNKLLIFFVLASSQIIDNINVTAFITAVNALQTHYDVTYSMASWTLSAYAVTFSSFIALFGRISDIIGHHIVFSTGLFALGIFSIVAAAVDNIYVLIVFRALQGVAAAATVPPSFAIVAHTFTGKALSIAIGCLAGALVISRGIGLILGGAFSEASIGYKGILWFTSAYALVNAFVAFIIIKPTKKGKSAGSMKKLDYFGIFLFITGAVILVAGFTEAGESWGKPSAYVLIIVGALMILSFLLWETLFFNGVRGKGVDLMIPQEMWKVKNFKCIPIVTVFLYGGFFAVFLLCAVFFQDVSKNSPIMASVKFAVPQSTVMIIVVLIMSFNYGRVSPKTLCSTGLAVAFVGILLLTRMSYSTEQYWRYALAGIILFAGGSCTYFINYLNLIMFATPLHLQGLVSGICLTVGQFGTAIAFAGITSIVGNSNETVDSRDKLKTIYINAMYLPLACYLTSLVLTVLLVRNLKPEDNKHGKSNEVDHTEASETELEKA